MPDTIERHVPLMAQNAKGPLFALLPGQYTALDQERDMPGFLRHVADKAKAACTLAPEACEKQVAEQVNRQAQQMWRRVWNPKLLMTREARDAERNAMRDRIAAGIAEPQAADKRALMHIIMANEISDSSPSQVLDAVIQNSGLSWGAHQIDIGANDGPEVAMFWDTLRAWRRAPGTGNYPLLRRADTYIACLSQPIRNYFTDHIAILYGGAPDMNKAFRSALAANRYEAHFRKWLGEETRTIGTADGPVHQESRSRASITSMSAIRRARAAARRLRQFGEAIPEEQYATCAGVEAGRESSRRLGQDPATDAALVGPRRRPPRRQYQQISAGFLRPGPRAGVSVRGQCGHLADVVSPPQKLAHVIPGLVPGIHSSAGFGGMIETQDWRRLQANLDRFDPWRNGSRQ